MKALKEKRVSLRSLLRGGLVILSIFALAFAACSSDSGGETPTPEPVPPPEPVPTSYITSIRIITQPQAISYQGAEPILEGLVAEVFWNDKPSYIETDLKKFFTIPRYADKATDVSAGSPFALLDITSADTAAAQKDEVAIQMTLAHVDGISGSVNTGLRIPFVVPIVDGQANFKINGSVTDWYSDSANNFDGLTYTVSFEKGSDGDSTDYDNWNITWAQWLDWKTDKYDDYDGTPGKGLAVNGNRGAGSKGTVKSFTYPVTAAYPKLDFSDFDPKTGNLKVNAWVGDVAGEGAWTDVNGNPELVSGFVVNKYYRVSQVEFKSADWKPYRDDNVDLFTWTQKDVDNKVPGAIAANIGQFSASKTFKLMQESNVKVNVYYRPDITEPKELDMEAFLKNLNYYNARFPADYKEPVYAEDQQPASLGDPWPGKYSSGKLKYQETVNWTPGEELTNIFTITMQYVPNLLQQYNADDSVNITKFSVPVEIFTGAGFDSTPVSRKAGTGPANVRLEAVKSESDTVLEARMDELVKELNKKWEINYTYERDGKTSIVGHPEITKEMIYEAKRAGAWPTGATSPLNASSVPFRDSIRESLQLDLPAPAVDTRYSFDLPIRVGYAYYDSDGVTAAPGEITAAEEGIVIDLVRRP